MVAELTMGIGGGYESFANIKQNIKMLGASGESMTITLLLVNVHHPSV